MKRHRFEDLCKKAQDGYTIMVLNPSEKEAADVLSCSLDSFLVFTRDAKHKSWNFRECQEITTRVHPQADIWTGFPDEK